MIIMTIFSIVSLSAAIAFGNNHRRAFFPLALLFLSLAAHGQQQERIAIINTMDDGEPPVGYLELGHLTDKFREAANNVLPKSRYAVMSTESIIAFLGSQEQAAKVCNESSCLAEIGRKVNADYVAQARIGRFESDFTIKAELYSSKSGAMVGSFTGDSKTLQGLRNIIDEKAPILLRKMPGASGDSRVSPTVTGGISGLESIGGSYETNYEKSYLANISTEPAGATLSFNGVPIASCSKTPCKAELPEGDIRIVAALEHYETADTAVSIRQNNQSIAIMLKPNFGILEIKPAYSDGIGAGKQWSLSINGKPYSFGEIRLSPNKYSVKLEHECYENISFEAGINKGKREVFEMAKHIALKKGGLVLSTEADDEPVSEQVFVNGKLAGETPFSGTVPVCARIEVGKGREMVNVEIKHNATKKHKHNMNTEERKRRQEAERLARLETEQREQQEARLAEKYEAKRTAWMMGWNFLVSGGVSLNMNNIEPCFKSLGGQWNMVHLEFYKRNLKFFRFGMNFDLGGVGVDRDAVRRMQPNVPSSISGIHFKGNAFARLYPVDFLFFSGGAGKDYFSVTTGETKPGSTKREYVDVVSISTPVFPIGGGICLCSSADNNGGGLFIEGLYNIVPFKERTVAYISINAGVKIHFGISY
jgi:hypothetical protein